MAAFAGERGLLLTGGSDYHGDTMDYGTAQATMLVPDAVAAALLEAMADLAARHGESAAAATLPDLASNTPT